MLRRNTAFMFAPLTSAANPPFERFETMSRQLTFSATVCALTMALFALTAGFGPGSPTGSADAVGAAPLAIAAAIG